eukprot:scaffold15017_cov64-Phaeocystis_antarctica.AAC.2
MSQHKAKRAKTKAPAVALPPSYEELAALHVATLTAVAFLAPKGVLCSLPVLQQSVAGLTTHALGVEQLQMMVALDASLGLRHAWIAPAPGAPPEEVLELVLREPLKVACSPGAVRSRARRFRALLEAAAASDPPVELPLAPLPPPAPAAHGVAEDGGGGGFSCAAEQADHHEEAADATRPSPTAVGEVTGLPSPPPKPLRRVVSSASGRAAAASGGGSGVVGAPVSGTQSAASAAPELSSTVEGAAAAEAAVEAEAKAAEAAEAAAEAAAAAGRSGCAAFLRRVRETPFYRGQIVHTHVTPAAPPRYVPLSCALAPAVDAALRASGIEHLYSHQAAAIDALLAGCDAVMLATPTASGKSLAYNVPCLHAVATDAAARAIYIFPTKALAQDQLRALRALCNAGATGVWKVPPSWCFPLSATPAAWGAGLRAWAALRTPEERRSRLDPCGSVGGAAVSLRQRRPCCASRHHLNPNPYPNPNSNPNPRRHRTLRHARRHLRRRHAAGRAGSPAARRAHTADEPRHVAPGRDA